MELFCFHGFDIKSTFSFMNAALFDAGNVLPRDSRRQAEVSSDALYRCVPRAESEQCTNWNWCNTYRSKLHTFNWHNIAAKHPLFLTFLLMHETFLFLFQVVLRTESVIFLYPPPPLTSHKNSHFWDNGVVFTHFANLKVNRKLEMDA